MDEPSANLSVKLVGKCEAKLFQRPYDAIHRGFDKEAEADFSGPDVFLSNFEPLTPEAARSLVEDVVEFDKFTEPMKQVLEPAARATDSRWAVSSANPRFVNGKPSKNPVTSRRDPTLQIRAVRTWLPWPRDYCEKLLSKSHFISRFTPCSLGVAAAFPIGNSEFRRLLSIIRFTIWNYRNC